MLNRCICHGVKGDFHALRICTVEYQGQYYHIPPSFIDPKPIQKPHPPIYLAAFTPPALKRVAQQADGWFPVLIPIGSLGQMFEGIREMAREAGRDPAALELIVRANVAFSEMALGGESCRLHRHT